MGLSRKSGGNEGSKTLVECLGSASAVGLRGCEALDRVSGRCKWYVNVGVDVDVASRRVDCNLKCALKGSACVRPGRCDEL